jgi:glycosyltransferase involved in cell wall biosynthesis
VLLNIVAGVRKGVPGARLVHVGGAFTAEQHALASTLGIKDAVVELPFLGRTLLAALYRRASVLALPSDREGFGLPLIEAMACGTPVVASAVPALQEAGGIAAIYCAPGDVEQWVETLTSLLRQRESDPAAWAARQTAGIVAAARFNWNTYATAMTDLYIKTGGRAALSQSTR